jgi:hypothetical protein
VSSAEALSDLTKLPRDLVFGGLLDLPRHLQRTALPSFPAAQREAAATLPPRPPRRSSAHASRVRSTATRSAPIGATVWPALLADPLDDADIADADTDGDAQPRLLRITSDAVGVR